MAFTVKEYRDLLQLLSQHPEWREELRRALLNEDFLALPHVVRELAEAQRRTEQRLEELAEAQRRTEQRVEELAEAQRRTEQRLEELAEAQRHTEEWLTRLEATIAALAEAQRRTEQCLEELAKAQHNTELRLQRAVDRLTQLNGRMLEIEYRNKAPSYFGQLLRRAQLVDLNDLEDLLEGHLPAEQIEDILRLDLVVRGRPRQALPGKERPELWLAVEVSAVVDRQDVERARRRAGSLRAAGLLALPVAAGESRTQGAEEAARASGVILLSDGKMDFHEEAIQKYIK